MAPRAHLQGECIEENAVHIPCTAAAQAVWVLMRQSHLRRDKVGNLFLIMAGGILQLDLLTEPAKCVVKTTLMAGRRGKRKRCSVCSRGKTQTQRC